MAERPLKRARTPQGEELQDGLFEQLPFEVFELLILPMNPLDVASLLAASPWFWRRVWPQLRWRYTEKWSTVWLIGADYQWNPVCSNGRRTHQIFKAHVTYKTRICDVWEFGIVWEYSYTQFPCYFDPGPDNSNPRWNVYNHFEVYEDLYFIHNDAHLLPFFVEQDDGTFAIDLNFGTVSRSPARPSQHTKFYVKELRTGKLVEHC